MRLGCSSSKRFMSLTKSINQTGYQRNRYLLFSTVQIFFLVTYAAVCYSKDFIGMIGSTPHVYRYTYYFTDRLQRCCRCSCPSIWRHETPPRRTDAPSPHPISNQSSQLENINNPTQPTLSIQWRAWNVTVAAPSGASIFQMNISHATVTVHTFFSSSPRLLLTRLAFVGAMRVFSLG